ncbi:MAG TPA: hypothetical protein VJ965_08630, partial [Anaerolineales bacterium]|nr:hypothetical protein [Anaerolineales bacterium]
MKANAPILLIIMLLVLAGCQAGQANVPTQAIHFTQEYTPTVTVPPLPSSTTWATKTPRPTETPTPT